MQAPAERKQRLVMADREITNAPQTRSAGWPSVRHRSGRRYDRCVCL